MHWLIDLLEFDRKGALAVYDTRRRPWAVRSGNDVGTSMQAGQRRVMHLPRWHIPMALLSRQEVWPPLTTTAVYCSVQPIAVFQASPAAQYVPMPMALHFRLNFCMHCRGQIEYKGLLEKLATGRAELK